MKSKIRFSGKLEEVSVQLELWRKGQPKGAGLPGSLWEKAVALSREHGVSRVARVLRLDFYKLRELGRMGLEVAIQQGSSGFVEVQGMPQCAAQMCRVEMENGMGFKMSLEFQASCPEEVVSLARELWRSQ